MAKKSESTEKNADKDLHGKHRERHRLRYLEQGADSFADHELLELLLFYSIPQHNTNGIAHRVLNEFGSLANLMDSNPKEIMSRTKLGKGTGILISLLLEFNRRYIKSVGVERNDLSSVKNVAAYLAPFFLGKRHELAYVMCLDSQNRLIHTVLLDEGSSNRIVIDPQKVARIALGNYSSSIILAHNHPSGNINPTFEDMETTRKLYTTLRLLRILLVDHIIIAGNKYFSFAENNKIEDMYDN